jgi:hypothetical protein
MSVIGGGARLLLRVTSVLVGVLTASALYLGVVTGADWLRGTSHQSYVYQWALITHLAVGLLVVVPFVPFALAHALAARAHPNRRAARVGYLLAALAAIVLVTGVALMRVAGIELRQPLTRTVVYWLHVVAPVAAFWASSRAGGRVDVEPRDRHRRGPDRGGRSAREPAAAASRRAGLVPAVVRPHVHRPHHRGRGADAR